MAKKLKKSGVKSNKSLGKFDVFSHLTLLNVRLVDVAAKLAIAKDSNLPETRKIEAGLSVGPSAEPDKILVDARVMVESPPGKQKDSETHLTIGVHFQCVYAIKGATVDKIAKHASILGQSGLLVMWPHLREVIQSISNRMGIPPIVLPFYLAGTPGPKKGTLVIQEVMSQHAE